jgi:hypothetical protein
MKGPILEVIMVVACAPAPTRESSSGSAQRARNYPKDLESAEPGALGTETCSRCRVGYVWQGWSASGSPGLLAAVLSLRLRRGDHPERLLDLGELLGRVQ